MNIVRYFSHQVALTLNFMHENSTSVSARSSRLLPEISHWDKTKFSNRPISFFVYLHFPGCHLIWDKTTQICKTQHLRVGERRHISFFSTLHSTLYSLRPHRSSVVKRKQSRDIFFYLFSHNFMQYALLDLICPLEEYRVFSRYILQCFFFSKDSFNLR